MLPDHPEHLPPPWPRFLDLDKRQNALRQHLSVLSMDAHDNRASASETSYDSISAKCGSPQLPPPSVCATSDEFPDALANSVLARRLIAAAATATAPTSAPGTGAPLRSVAHMPSPQAGLHGRHQMTPPGEYASTLEGLGMWHRELGDMAIPRAAHSIPPHLSQSLGRMDGFDASFAPFSPADAPELSMMLSNHGCGRRLERSEPSGPGGVNPLSLDVLSTESLGTSVPPPPPPPLPASNTTGRAVPSIGSLGHPTDCNPPCRHVRKAVGCRDGWSCPKCHLCEWRHLGRWRRQPGNVGGQMSAVAVQDTIVDEVISGTPSTNDVSTSTNDLRPPGPEAEVELQAQSIGSIDHPNRCGPPCRYHWRKEGCRNGHACLCCHCCQWQRLP